MVFRLIKTGITYADPKDDPIQVLHDLGDCPTQSLAYKEIFETIPNPKQASAIIWKGTAAEYQSLLVIREAELILAKSQLTGKDWVDWYLNNQIANLEIQITDLKRWLSEALNYEQRGSNVVSRSSIDDK